jgi:hypothetical protein
MSLLYITPLTMVGPDGYQMTGKDCVPVLEVNVTTIIVDFSSAAAVSTILPHVADASAARLYHIYADAACHIKGHAAGDNLNSKATTSHMPFGANESRFYAPSADLAYISAIAAA